MARGGNAPRQGTWLVCLVLYLVALLAHFGVIRIDLTIALWSWVLGFGLLLVACKVRGL